jgi:hypothetical protein
MIRSHTHRCHKIRLSRASRIRCIHMDWCRIRCTGAARSDAFTCVAAGSDTGAVAGLETFTCAATVTHAALQHSCCRIDAFTGAAKSTVHIPQRNRCIRVSFRSTSLGDNVADMVYKIAAPRSCSCRGCDWNSSPSLITSGYIYLIVRTLSMKRLGYRMNS